MGLLAIDLFPQFGALCLHFADMCIAFCPFCVFADRFIRIVFGFCQDPACFFVCILQDAFFGVVYFVVFFAQFFAQSGNLFAAFRSIGKLFFKTDTCLLQICKYIFKLCGIACYVVFGIFDNIVGQSQLVRNGKRITFTGNTDQQTVSRP